MAEDQTPPANNDMPETPAEPTDGGTPDPNETANDDTGDTPARGDAPDLSEMPEVARLISDFLDELQIRLSNLIDGFESGPRNAPDFDFADLMPDDARRDDPADDGDTQARPEFITCDFFSDFELDTEQPPTLDISDMA